MQGDVVQHNGADDFVDSAGYLEERGEDSPESAGEGCDSEAEGYGDPGGLREKGGEPCSEPCCCERTD